MACLQVPVQHTITASSTPQSFEARHGISQGGLSQWGMASSFTPSHQKVRVRMCRLPFERALRPLQII